MSKEIKLFFHCAECLSELPDGQTPSDYSRLAVGWTAIGLQVWCNRHECNILHIDFEGVKHKATSGDAQPSPQPTRLQ